MCNSVHRVLAFVACVNQNVVRYKTDDFGEKNRPLFTFASIADAFLSKKQDAAYKLLC